MAKDYYEILGIDKNSTEVEIKSAYRKKAKEHHPDKGGDEAEFKDLNEAYSVLSNPEKKQRYDQFGTSDPQQGFGGFGFDINEIFRNQNPFGDFFHGFGEQKQRVRKGQNIRIKVKLTLEEIIRGCKKKVKISKQTECEKCKGTGSKDGKTISCTTCGGSGTLIQSQQTPIGHIRTQTTCHTCNGEGKIIKDKCIYCKGIGTIPKDEIIDIDMPAGILDGMTLSMPGKGNSVKDGINGDLMILIEEIPHSKFERQDSDLHYTHKVSLIDLILGSPSEIDTIEGKIRINIDPGTPVGKILKVKGKGIPHYNSGYRGDLLIKIDAQIPKSVTEEEKEILKKLKTSKNFK